MLRTRENSDVFNSLDEIYFGIHLKKANILYVSYLFLFKAKKNLCILHGQVFVMKCCLASGHEVICLGSAQQRLKITLLSVAEYVWEQLAMDHSTPLQVVPRHACESYSFLLNFSALDNPVC